MSNMAGAGYVMSIGLSGVHPPDIESDTVVMVTSKSPNSTCPMKASMSATHMTVHPTSMIHGIACTRSLHCHG